LEDEAIAEIKDEQHEGDADAYYDDEEEGEYEQETNAARQKSDEEDSELLRQAGE
jgi:hypothetical protein